MPREKFVNASHRQRYGQFFSPDKLVKQCISIIENTNGRLLEPSCGDGAFGELIDKKDSVFIEIDKNVITDSRVLNVDFFDYPISEKFDTIIGNPPYVDNSILPEKYKSESGIQLNLYLLFIEKCIKHLNHNGELIFIVPRDFIKATSARSINKKLYETGTITHFYDYGDEKLFDGACPNVCVFRFQKDNFTRRTKTFNGSFDFLESDGIISFGDSKNSSRLGDLFEVKVGAVSGADKYFIREDSGEDFVYSKTRVSGATRKMLYGEIDDALKDNKTALIDRRIKNFSEDNWFEWGRVVNFCEDRERIYVNCKTRISKPFFCHPCKKWDGSVLALFPKRKMDINHAIDILNNFDWSAAGFMTGGRYLFSQKALLEVLVDDKDFR